MLSCVIPTLNAAETLGATIVGLKGAAAEIVVVDGGSSDGTGECARRLGATVALAPPSRGRQLAAGVAASRGDWLLLLHADTVLEPSWIAEAETFMASRTGYAGYFRFALDSADPRARRLERAVAWRCRVFGLPYGDQGLLLPRRLLEQVGGIRPLRLMEDVDLARRLRRRLIPLRARAVTSARRWEAGYLRRSARNLACLMLYFAGVSPERIAKLYG